MFHYFKVISGLNSIIDFKIGQFKLKKMRKKRQN